MENYFIKKLKLEARKFYRALIEGRPIEGYQKKIKEIIRKMIIIGISKSKIDDIMTDAALEVL